MVLWSFLLRPTIVKYTLSPFKNTLTKHLHRAVIMARKLSEHRFSNDGKFFASVKPHRLRLVRLDSPWLTTWFPWKPLDWSWWMVLGYYFISINLDWTTYMKCTLSPFKEQIKQTPLSRAVIVVRKLSELRFPNGWKFWGQLVSNQQVRSSTHWQRSLWLVSVDAPWLKFSIVWESMLWKFSCHDNRRRWGCLFNVFLKGERVYFTIVGLRRKDQKTIHRNQSSGFHYRSFLTIFDRRKRFIFMSLTQALRL